ncbi:hypothetical protein [Streptomyces sp. NPDC008001]|uniref:hypothetical protein n=1 Tax=Streptomyces sp. NPDC008001 TaxID=3364804 RepID=UPI0036EB9B5C
MDFDAVADELYGMRPNEFTAARDRHAAAAREAGDRALAKRIKELRRPTAAAWAGNLLVRRSPEQVDALLRLGESLRRAHRELDGARLRELSRRQYALVTTLAQQARQLAAEAGTRIGDAAQREIEATLHAALADPGAAQTWAAGRLDRALSAPVGFPGVSSLSGVPGAAAGRPLPTSTQAPASATAARGRRRAGRTEHGGTSAVSELEAARARRRERENAERKERAEQKEREERAERIERARRDAGRARAACLPPQQDFDRAVLAVRQTAEEIENLKQRLEEARTRHRAAQDDERQARGRLREAERAARKAERHAEAAEAGEHEE